MTRAHAVSDDWRSFSASRPRHPGRRLGDVGYAVEKTAEDAAGMIETAVKRAEGVPGLLTNEIAVRGIVQTRGQFVAMVAGVGD